jgi:hypothetical protein
MEAGDERGIHSFASLRQKKFYKLRSCFRISKENKGLRFGLVAKICEKEWYALDATDKKKNHDMLEEYKKQRTVSMQSILWLGKPYSFIPWLWSIAFFHRTLASSTLFHQFLQLETKQVKKNKGPIMNENDKNASNYPLKGILYEEKAKRILKVRVRVRVKLRA